VLPPYQTTVYNYVSWMFGDFPDNIIESSFRELTNNRALTRSLFNSWDNRDKLLFDIIKDYSKLYGSISDRHLIDNLDKMTLQTRRDNISIRDLSINTINGIYSGLSEKARPKFIKDKKRFSNFKKFRNYHTAGGGPRSGTKSSTYNKK
jgi:hypothetical protein